METHEIRRRFLDHFVQAGHLEVPSGSLVSDDPTVLFTIAGMAPMKRYFLGQAQPPAPKVTSVQKCVRTLDIDNVGHTTRHNTFFQMAGNFSFGQYFKEGAIDLAWRLVTGSVDDGGLGFDPERIWVTVYEHDDEAIELWQRLAGLPLERIQRRGMDDNYWSMGVPGPSGPCSEIYYDRGPEFGAEGGPVVDEDRYLEIWNLVFMQDVRGANAGSGKSDFPIVGELPQRNIDTGLGVERVAFLLQGVDNVYETDLLRPIISLMEKLSGKAYGHDDSADNVRFRVIADHIRSGTLLVADGVTPGNEGRGYVLRRLLRRTVRAARLLGVDRPVLGELSAVVRDLMMQSYPEVATDYPRIERIVQAEETAFLKTLTSGSRLFEVAAEETKRAGKTAVDGATAFTLHDTQGFPIDLTLEMAAEAGLTVDTEGFARLMSEQKSRARADARARKGQLTDMGEYRRLLAQGQTEFTGYTELASEGTVLGLLTDGVSLPAATDGDVVDLVLDRTPLYAESGGQEADQGTISGANFAADVLDVQKVDRRLWVHKIRVTDGEVRPGAAVLAQVDPEWRIGARQAHSGTHVVHAALRQVLGPTALQAGSYNKPGYLRLDFSAAQGLSAATRSEIEEVANLAVRGDLSVRVVYGSKAEADAMGAIALFGETYDDIVRIVEIGGPWSVELCGGTHVDHSSQIGPLVITGESSVGSGVRRLEAAVGIDAFHRFTAERALLALAASSLKVPPTELPDRIAALAERLRVAEKELERYRAAEAGVVAASLAHSVTQVGAVGLVAAALPAGTPAADVRAAAVDVRGRLGDRAAVVALFAATGDAASFAIALSPAAVASGLAAGKLAGSFLPAIDGRGGGRPDLAQGGGANPSGIPDAINALTAALAAAGDGSGR